ncbi:MAG: PTS sugar transporter subunit IIA [Proteobacteria bacterium]|nr:PTS sugar transporter subunit IIA [Pseudomonadota bacterium]
MKLLDILKPTAVIPELKGKHKKEVLEELCHVVAESEKLKPEPLLNVLLEREKLGSTGIGDGIAIPHGKCRDCRKLTIACGRSLEGVDFDSMDGKPTQLFFLLVAPEDSAGIHLKALAKISRLLKDSGFRQKFMAARDAREMYELISARDDDF